MFSSLERWIECSFHPHGIGNLNNDLLEEFDANANFLFIIKV
ncbi:MULTISPECIES: hypothetical protein [Bacillus]|nr:hypothetical protein [Bacillus pumilus]